MVGQERERREKISEAYLTYDEDIFSKSDEAIAQAVDDYFQLKPRPKCPQDAVSA
jgi:hypothetical protein